MDQPQIVQHAVLLSLLLFGIGTLGVFLRRNVITVLMSIELMLNGANLAFVAFSRASGVLDGQVLVFFVMARLPGVQLQRGAESGWGVVALSLAVLVASFAVSWLLSRTPYLRRAV